MDLVEPIFSVALSIYNLTENVKANKERYLRVSSRVKGLEDVIRSIQEQDLKDVEEPLKELYTTLISAKKLLEKYTLARKIIYFVKVRSIGDDFDSLNHRLDDVHWAISLALNLAIHDNILRMKDDLSAKKTDDAEMLKCEEKHVAFFSVHYVQ